MKMPQEKNGVNIDLKCDLVLCRNKDYEKEDITRLETFEMNVWRRMEKISWTEHISNEVLKLVEEERSLLTIIRTRQRNWMEQIMQGNYRRRRRADQQKSTAAPTNCRRRRRCAAGARL